VRTLAARLRRATREVPILAIRLPDLERTAWKRGRGAARRLERRAADAFLGGAASLLRRADLLAHDERSEIFLAALLDRARERSAVPSPTDCRNAVQRLSAALARATGLRVESGWTIVQSVAGDPNLCGTVDRALERGARERERYDFFSTVGHELRTPLTSIRGYLETLLAGELGPDVVRHFLEIAHAESLRLARLLDGMFEISLFDMRVLRRNEAASDVAVVLDRAVEVLLPLAKTRGVTIALQPLRAHAQVDADHMMQMVVNLIENAIKHGRADGRVCISGTIEGDRYVQVHVDDDGPGVVVAEREAIFALSARGSTTAQGTGIGLAFVRLMVERIGGDVTAGEAPSGGARFTLRLPAASSG
jgi:signal transduction histidine kinase